MNPATFDLVAKGGMFVGGIVLVLVGSIWSTTIGAQHSADLMTLGTSLVTLAVGAHLQKSVPGGQ